MDYMYSATTGGFYPDELKESYEAAGSWKSDAKPVSDSDYEVLFNGLKAGKIIVPNEEGYPALRDPLPPTPEQRTAEAEREKRRLVQEANEIIAPLADAVDLAMATDVEKEKLIAWKKYRVQLSRIDVNTTPNITWPAEPEV